MYHAQIKQCIVHDKHGGIIQIFQYFIPDLRKCRCVFYIFTGYAMHTHGFPVKVRFGIDIPALFKNDVAILFHHDTDLTHTVVRGIGRFGI